ncbi:MAG TPA: paraquat-inducible membrane protein A [Alcaligenaceae bacterium]|nr:paraquat-inducible membrane protein A [Alcaligenaceae bacterium]
MSRSNQKITCWHCGALYQRAILEPGEIARCPRCDTVLEAYGAFTPSAWLAIMIGAAIFLLIANAFPIMTLNVQGITQSASFFDTIKMTWEAGYQEVAVMSFLVGFMLPVCHLMLLIWVFGALSFDRKPLFFESCLRWIDRLTPWCMVPVFLVGVLVSIVKLVGLASVTPGMGLFSTAFCVVLLTAISRLNSRKIRFMAHDLGLPVRDMPVLKAPSPLLINRTWALIAAAVLLYFPANLLPIMKVTTLGSPVAHTIMEGVIELWQLGSWDIALVVFIASVIVPTFKLIALSWLVYMTHTRSSFMLKKRTHLYEAVEFIGQWSMLDIFVVILMTALAHFGSVFSIEPGIGAACFGAVVVLTMFAAMGFDPRLSWRLAGHRRHLLRSHSDHTHT